MSGTELPADMGTTKRAPIWAVALAATLLAASFGRRRSEAAAASDQAARRFDEDTPAGGDRALADEGRGRAADTPSEIPARGWKDILLRVYRGISEDRILLVAAGVTFAIGDLFDMFDFERGAKKATTRTAETWFGGSDAAHTDRGFGAVFISRRLPAALSRKPARELAVIG
jgi:hypothetical protein